MGKSAISMAIFISKLLVYQRLVILGIHGNWDGGVYDGHISFTALL